MQCINCGGPAEWVFQNSGTADQPYCRLHVPKSYWGHPGLVQAAAEAPEVVEAVEPEVKPKPRPRKRAPRSASE